MTPGALGPWDADPGSERVLVLSDLPGSAEHVASTLRQTHSGVVTVAPADLTGYLTRPGTAAVVIEAADPIPLIRRTHELDTHAVILLLTDRIDGPRVAELFRAGAADVLPEPRTPDRIRESLALALERRRELVRRDSYTAWLRNLLAELRSDVEREAERVVQHSVAALEVLTQTLEAKDPYMAGHSVRVAEVAACIASTMGRSEWEVERIRLAGRLHDIGMIAVPYTLLARAGPLSEPEYAVVREHVTVASKILAPFESLSDVIAWIRGHHERWDGSGYPDGLGGEAIPWGARVLAAAEIFDALATSRPYQAAIPPHECLSRMRSMSGSTLDPAVYEALVAVVNDGRLLPFLHPPEAAGRASIESWTLTHTGEPHQRATG